MALHSSSSGTWSLIGTELDAPVVTPEALRLNFTNEGGVNGTTRLLKNVMGLWMLQGCRNCWSARGHDSDYRELVELAGREPAFAHLVDPMTSPSCARPICWLPSINSAGKHINLNRPLRAPMCECVLKVWL